MDNSAVKTGKLWDIFCQVIDNYGDIGVGWRLATNLAARGQRVRLWLDNSSVLRWLAPGGDCRFNVAIRTLELAADQFARHLKTLRVTA